MKATAQNCMIYIRFLPGNYFRVKWHPWPLCAGLDLVLDIDLVLDLNIKISSGRAGEDTVAGPSKGLDSIR
jgi:hypothetical protein